MMERSFDIRRIFWPLLGFSLLLAVCGAALAIWFATKPLLLDSKTAALIGEAEKQALSIEAHFTSNTVAARFLAADDIVSGFVIGAILDETRVRDRLAELTEDAGLTQITLFGFDGDAILTRQAEGGEQTPTHGQDSAELAQRILAASNEDRPSEPLVRVVDGYGLIAAPVSRFGFVEGAIVVAFEMAGAGLVEMEDAVSALHERDDQPLSNSGNGALVVPIGQMPLYLSVRPTSSSVNAAGLTLVKAGVFAVSMSLLIPFGFLAAIGHRAILRPHDELASSRALLREQKQELGELATIAMRADDSIILTDLTGRTRWVNPAFEKMSGFLREEIIGHRPEDLIASTARDPETVAELEDAFKSRQAIQIETQNRHKDGHDYWVRLSISPLLDDQDFVYGFVCISNDITVEREHARDIAKAQEAIAHQALHDELTGLANRRAFNMELEQRLAHASANQVTLIRIDLDHFKAVNDTLGHEAGDDVLVAVANILREETREHDLPVRIGGDEFVILLRNSCPIAGAVQLSERIRQRIAQPIETGQGMAQVGASFGVATSGKGAVDPDEVLRAADTALYAAKDRGRDQVVVHDDAMSAAAASSRAIETDLRDSLSRGDFVPFFQPQVDAKTGEIAGVEVLARWRHPTRGVLPPAAFLEAAERLGLMDQLDRQVMETALQDAMRLEVEGCRFNAIAFNITPSRIAGGEVAASLRTVRLQHTRIGLEILESVFLDRGIDGFDEELRVLRQMGAKIEIDDFGSGHTSVISMLRIGPDTLKIDGRLVMEALDSRRHCEILRAIISISRALDLAVVAEGVETPEHAELMRSLGCDILQGYFFAKPMPIDDLRTLLMTRAAA